MKFHLTITEEDYIAFNIDHAAHSPSAQKNILLGRWMMLFVSACFMIVALLTGMTKPYLFAEIAALTILSVVWYFRYPKQYQNAIRKGIEKLKKEGRLPYSPETDIDFTATEIVETAPDHTSHRPYSDVIAIRETEELLLLQFGAMETYILPIRCLGERKQELLDFLHEKCTNIKK